MKVCLISLEWPPYSGGIATYMFSIAKALCDAGNKVTVVTSTEKAVELEGVEIHIVPIGESKAVFPKLKKWRMEPFDSWSVKSFDYFTLNFTKDDFDIIETAEYGAWARKFTNGKVPIVTRCHNTTKIVWSINCQNRKPFLPPLWVMFQDYKERTQTYNSDGITAPSYSIANHISLEWNIERSDIKVIPNPIDTSLFCPLEKRDISTGREILYIGRFQYGKGVYDFLNAVIPVLEEHSDVTARLLGFNMPSPDDYSEYGSTATDVIMMLTPPYLRNRIFIESPVEQHKTIDFYRASYCVVIPTRGYESFSYTCLEAMACGCAIIATKSGGPTELLNHGVSGHLVEPGNVNEISQSLNLLLADKKYHDKLGNAARKAAVKNYHISKIAKATTEYYQAVINKYEVM